MKNDIEEQHPEHATVREVLEFKVAVEKRFGRLEKLILGGVFFNGAIAAVMGTGKVKPDQIVALVQNIT